MNTKNYFIDPFGSDQIKRRDSGDGLIPLINIVFLLLVFFMVAGQIQATDRFNVKPPLQAEIAEQENEPASLQITSDGRIVFQSEEISIEGLRLALASEQIDLKKPSVLKVDKEATAQQLDRVLDVFRDSAATSIKIQIRQSAYP